MPLHALAAEREARLLQVLRHLGGGEAPHQLLLLVAQALLLEAGADARLQQHRVHRLGQVVLGAQLDAAHDVVQALERRGHDHRQVAQLRVGLQLLEHLEAVHLGHLDVEQQQVEAARARSISSATRPFSAQRDAMALQLQAARQQQAVDLVVVDDQQARAVLSHGAAPSAPPRRARYSSSSAASAAASRALGIEALSSSSRASAPSRECAEGVAVRLERVRRAPKAFGVAGGAARGAARPACAALLRGTCPPARRRTRRRRVLQLGEDGGIDRRLVPCQRTSSRPARASSASTSCVDPDRLGHVVVHARGQAHLAVALHRVGGHRDDARALAGAATAR